jgi:hypothetical protein
VSYAEKFREKAEEYAVLETQAPSLVMRAWYNSLRRSYELLADDEDRHYAYPILPVIDTAPMQPSDNDLRTLDELEADLAALAALRQTSIAAE